MHVNVTQSEFAEIQRMHLNLEFQRDARWRLLRYLHRCHLLHGGDYDPNLARTGMVPIELRVIGNGCGSG